MFVLEIEKKKHKWMKRRKRHRITHILHIKWDERQNQLQDECWDRQIYRQSRQVFNAITGQCIIWFNKMIPLQNIACLLFYYGFFVRKTHIHFEIRKNHTETPFNRLMTSNVAQNITVLLKPLHSPTIQKQIKFLSLWSWLSRFCVVELSLYSICSLSWSFARTYSTTSNETLFESSICC